LAVHGSNQDTADCAAYLKSTAGFQRVMLKMMAKVKSLGTVGGTIVLSNPSAAEKEALAGLMRKNYAHHKQITLSLASFQESIRKTKYKDADLFQVLRLYFDDPLASTKSLALAYADRRDTFFDLIWADCRETVACQWFEKAYHNRKGIYTVLIKRYDAEFQLSPSEPMQLKSELNFICRGLNRLPYLSGKQLRLPVFAVEVARDPHFFDWGTFPGQMLVSGICHRFDAEKPVTAEQRAMLLYQAGILTDDVSNHVLCYGLEAEHPGWAGFADRGEPMVATLANLNRVSNIRAANNRVYIFENPAVFSVVLDQLNEKSSRTALICTYGQVKIAALVMLDLLAKNECRMYYAGDFDPEGLQIADRLKSRYGEKLTLWHYSAEDYLFAQSDKLITPARLQKLNSLRDPDLAELSAMIKSRGVAGYQERLIDQYLHDLTEATGD